MHFRLVDIARMVALGVVLLGMAGGARAQSFRWAKSAGGSRNDYSSDVACLADGGMVATGFFTYMATFGKGEPNEQTLLAPDDFMRQTPCMFVARYGSGGTLDWVRQTSGTAEHGSHGSAILPTADGGFYLSGTFARHAVLGRGEPAQATLATSSTALFLARYRGDGSLVWARMVADGGVSTATIFYPYSMAPAPDGGVFLPAIFFDRATLGPGDANQRTLTARGASDIFLARFDAQGGLVWARQGGGELSPVPSFAMETAHCVQRLTDGNLMLVGFFYDHATFESSGGTTVSLTAISTGLFDAYFAKYSPEGELLWIKRCGSAESANSARSVAAATDGGFYVSGNFSGFPTADGGNAVLARFRSDGSLIWASGLGGTETPSAIDLAIDASGEIDVLCSDSNNGSIILAKFGRDGTLKQKCSWVNSYGAALAAGSDGNLWVTGSFSGTPWWSSGGTGQIGLTSTNSIEDIFLMNFYDRPHTAAKAWLGYR